MLFIKWSIIIIQLCLVFWSKFGNNLYGVPQILSITDSMRINESDDICYNYHIQCEKCNRRNWKSICTLNWCFSFSATFSGLSSDSLFCLFLTVLCRPLFSPWLQILEELNGHWEKLLWSSWLLKKTNNEMFTDWFMKPFYKAMVKSVYIKWKNET